jgi:aspartate-semialdehyde dehydrogenase
MSLKIAIIGATGLVGKELINLFEKSSYDLDFLLLASEKSIGKNIIIKNKEHRLQNLNEKVFDNVDFAFFAAGGEISKKYIPLAVKKNVLCIDLSSYFRMDKKVALIIPEINFDSLNKNHKIIASPNCTTTIMLMALYPLHKKYNIKRIVSASYQAASGGGMKLLDKLKNDTINALETNNNYDYGFNVFLHESKINKNYFSLEEEKMILESHKILNNNKIKISPTCVRVPVKRSHGLSLNVEFEKDLNMSKVYNLLENFKGILLFDKNNKKFATPNDANHKNDVIISRVRRDFFEKNILDMWVVADQLLKGASLNAFQIFEKIIKKN